MDAIDRKIATLLQTDGRASNAEIAEHVGVSVSTAHERVRKMAASGEIKAWRAVLEPAAVGAGLCVFVLVDMQYDGEEDACAVLAACPEVQELHHISGPHSYLMKLRLRDSRALQRFLQEVLKPLPAVERSETLLSLDALKESTALPIEDPEPRAAR